MHIHIYTIHIYTHILIYIHSWNPPPLLIKGGRTFQKLSHLGGGGGMKFFARKGG